MAMSSGGKINNVSIENASTYWSTYLSSLSAASQSKFYVATTVDALGTAQAGGGGGISLARKGCNEKMTMVAMNSN